MNFPPRDFDGLVLIDKPQGWTSHDVVQKLRKILGTKSVGHTGTLDPLATGLLVVVVGRATRLSDYLMAADKSYEMKIQVGVETDSWDRDGKVVKETSTDGLSETQIRDVISELEGDFDWPVPAYSAVKVDGKKLYERARADQPVPEVTREMSFYDVKTLTVSSKECRVQLICSKGSYMRTWAHILGERLGVGATVAELRRLTVGPYKVENAVTLEALQSMSTPEQPMDGDGNAKGAGPSQSFSQAFIPMAQLLPDWPIQKVAGKDEALIKNGQIPNRLHGPMMSLMIRAVSHDEGKVPQGIKILSGESGRLISLVLPSGNGGFRLGCVFSQ